MGDDSMTRRWIRLDAEWEDSGWLYGLGGHAAGCWPRLLCWVKLRGVAGRCRFPSNAVLAHQWRTPEPVIAQFLEAAMREGAIRMEDGDLVVDAWNEYQKPDDTAAERKRRQRERDVEKSELSRVSRRDTVTSQRDPSMSTSSTGVEVEVRGVQGGDDPVPWMHAVWNEMLGKGRALDLTPARRQKYRAMHDEHLFGSPNPEMAWRAVLWALKQSEFHMGKREYQLPESFLRSPERRSQWVEKAIELDRPSDREQKIADMAEFIRRRRGA